MAVVFFGYSAGQSINNVRAEKMGDNVKILYDLQGGSPEALFDVAIYGSHNNFTAPLTLVTGDIGKRIQPGNNREVIWRAKEELINYRGEVIFEVKATVMGGYYSINNPGASSSFKRGKLMPINWSGGATGENVKIELYKNQVKSETISESISNQGSYVWTIPKGLKTGSGYQVKISNTRDYEQQGISKTFKLKKFPVGITVFVGAAAIGGALYAAGIFGSKEEPPTNTNNPPVDDPPVDDPVTLPSPPPPPSGRLSSPWLYR